MCTTDSNSIISKSMPDWLSILTCMVFFLRFMLFAGPNKLILNAQCSLVVIAPYFNAHLLY